MIATSKDNVNYRAALTLGHETLQLGVELRNMGNQEVIAPIIQILQVE